jgi:hypothetical protein
MELTVRSILIYVALYKKLASAILRVRVRVKEG